MDNDIEIADGLWVKLPEAELHAQIKLKEFLQDFYEATKAIYSCAVQVPTLSNKEQSLNMRVAALFLKRSLNDMRSLWLLIERGYSSQAASVGASLYENALAATIIAGNEKYANKVINSKNGDLPWGAKKLGELYSKKCQQEERQAGRENGSEEVKEHADSLYAVYKWLCKLKHPTLPSVVHDSMSASVKAGEYIVMAFPDLRDEDLAVKKNIMVIALVRVHAAVDSFFKAIELDSDASECQKFKERVDRGFEKIKEIALK